MTEPPGLLLAIDYIPITDPCGGGPGYEYSFNMASFIRAMSEAQFLVEPFLKYPNNDPPSRVDATITARRATGLFYFHTGMNADQMTSMTFPMMVYECMKYANPVLRRYVGMPAEYMTINRGVIEYLKCWTSLYTKLHGNENERYSRKLLKPMTHIGSHVIDYVVMELIVRMSGTQTTRTGSQWFYSLPNSYYEHLLKSILPYLHSPALDPYAFEAWATVRDKAGGQEKITSDIGDIVEGAVCHMLLHGRYDLIMELAGASFHFLLQKEWLVDAGQNIPVGLNKALGLKHAMHNPFAHSSELRHIPYNSQVAVAEAPPPPPTTSTAQCAGYDNDIIQQPAVIVIPDTTGMGDEVTTTAASSSSGIATGNRSIEVAVPEDNLSHSFEAPTQLAVSQDELRDKPDAQAICETKRMYVPLTWLVHAHRWEVYPEWARLNTQVYAEEIPLRLTHHAHGEWVTTNIKGVPSHDGKPTRLEEQIPINPHNVQVVHRSPDTLDSNNAIKRFNPFEFPAGTIVKVRLESDAGKVWYHGANANPSNSYLFINSPASMPVPSLSTDEARDRANNSTFDIDEGETFDTRQQFHGMDQWRPGNHNWRLGWGRANENDVYQMSLENFKGRQPPWWLHLDHQSDETKRAYDPKSMRFRQKYNQERFPIILAMVRFTRYWQYQVPLTTQADKDAWHAAQDTAYRKRKHLAHKQGSRETERQEIEKHRRPIWKSTIPPPSNCHCTGDLAVTLPRDSNKLADINAGRDLTKPACYQHTPAAQRWLDAQKNRRRAWKRKREYDQVTTGRDRVNCHSGKVRRTTTPEYDMTLPLTLPIVNDAQQGSARTPYVYPYPRDALKSYLQDFVYRTRPHMFTDLLKRSREANSGKDATTGGGDGNRSIESPTPAITPSHMLCFAPRTDLGGSAQAVEVDYSTLMLTIIGPQRIRQLPDDDDTKQLLLPLIDQNNANMQTMVTTLMCTTLRQQRLRVKRGDLKGLPDDAACLTELSAIDDGVNAATADNNDPNDGYIGVEPCGISAFAPPLIYGAEIHEEWDRGLRMYCRLTNLTPHEVMSQINNDPGALRPGVHARPIQVLQLDMHNATFKDCFRAYYDQFEPYIQDERDTTYDLVTEMWNTIHDLVRIKPDTSSTDSTCYEQSLRDASRSELEKHFEQIPEAVVPVNRLMDIKERLRQRFHKPEDSSKTAYKATIQTVFCGPVPPGYTPLRQEQYNGVTRTTCITTDIKHDQPSNTVRLRLRTAYDSSCWDMQSGYTPPQSQQLMQRCHATWYSIYARKQRTTNNLDTAATPTTDKYYTVRSCPTEADFIIRTDEHRPVGTVLTFDTEHLDEQQRQDAHPYNESVFSNSEWEAKQDDHGKWHLISPPQNTMYDDFMVGQIHPTWFRCAVPTTSSLNWLIGSPLEDFPLDYVLYRLDLFHDVMMRTNGCPDDELNSKLDAMAGCLDDTSYTRRLQAMRPCKFVTDALPWGNYSPDPHADNSRYEMEHKPMHEFLPSSPDKITCSYQGKDLSSDLTYVTYNRDTVERHRSLEAWDDHRARFFHYREQQTHRERREDADDAGGDGGGNRSIEPPDPSSSSSHTSTWTPYEGTPTACLKDFQKHYMHCDSMDMLILRLANMEQPGGEDDRFPVNRKPPRRDNERNPAYTFIDTMLAYLIPQNERHVINIWCLDARYFKSARTTYTSASDLHALTSTCWTVMSRWYALELFRAYVMCGIQRWLYDRPTDYPWQELFIPRPGFERQQPTDKQPPFKVIRKTLHPMDQRYDNTPLWKRRQQERANRDMTLNPHRFRKAVRHETTYSCSADNDNAYRTHWVESSQPWAGFRRHRRD
jgi:hypothetical protein